MPLPHPTSTGKPSERQSNSHAQKNGTPGRKAAMKCAAERPPSLPVVADGIPKALRALPQWILWRWERTDSGWSKVPYQAKAVNRKASSTDPATWSAFAEAMGVYLREHGKFDGVGFVLAADGGLAAVDLDDCRDPDSGVLHQWARGVVEALATYTEASPTGTGVKVYLRGRKPAGACSFKGDVCVEIYDGKRYLCVTGHGQPWMPDEPAESQEALSALHARLTAEDQARRKPRAAATTAAPPDGHAGDVEKRAVAYLLNCPGAVSGQKGHDATLYAARAMVHGFDLGPAVGYHLLAAHYNPRCQPPWSEADLRRKCEQADVVPFDKPRGWLLHEGRCQANGATAAKDSPSAAAAEDGAAVILAYLREKYRPEFRRGNVIHCADGREVGMAEACAVPTSKLIARLAVATNAPRIKGEVVNRDALPAFFKRWAPTAWGDLLESLSDEDEAELAPDGAAPEEFRRMVRDAMLSEVVLGEVVGDSGVTQTERNSLVRWCERFAKAGPWRSIRGKMCWCRYRELAEGELDLRVAIRHELFAQLRADRRLCAMGPKAFTRRAARYGVGRSTRDDRPHGRSAVVLDRDFVADLLASLPDDEGDPPER